MDYSIQGRDVNTPSRFVTHIVAHTIIWIGADYMCFRKVHQNKTVDLVLFYKSDPPNTSPYARFMQSQKATNAYSLAGQQAPLYSYTASRRRPPAIPVRSRVAIGQRLRPQPLVTADHLLAGMSFFEITNDKRVLLVIWRALFLITQSNVYCKKKNNIWLSIFCEVHLL